MRGLGRGSANANQGLNDRQLVVPGLEEASSRASAAPGQLKAARRRPACAAGVDRSPAFGPPGAPGTAREVAGTRAPAPGSARGPARERAWGWTPSAHVPAAIQRADSAAAKR